MNPEQPKRVLVVDDDPEIRLLLVSSLSRRGLSVDEAADGVQAIAALRENQYAVILLDVMLPGVDGFAVLEHLGAADTASPPVVLVITGADRTLLDRLDAQRIHGVLKKPFDVDELAALVMTCAEIKSRSTFSTMAIATMIAGGPFLALLDRLAR